MFLLINTDGGVIDNKQDPPGLASAAYVVKSLEAEYLGSQSSTFYGTNNDAEYRAVLLALHGLKEFPNVEGVYIKADSQLIVNQILGDWKCKHPQMKKYLAEINKLRQELDCMVSFSWIPRELNTEADWLCTHALYRGPKTSIWDPIPAMVPRKTLAKVANNEAVLCGV